MTGRLSPENRQATVLAQGAPTLERPKATEAVRLDHAHRTAEAVVAAQGLFEANR